MKINSKIVAIACLAIGVVIGSNNFAVSDPSTQKIAVIDVQSVIAKSAQVKALKNEQAKKAQELQKWLETANSEIKKQTSDVEKQKMIKKYQQDLATKREANAKAYAQKLSAIDANISATIASQAKAKGYAIVLTKSSVLYGGDDITAEIAKVVK